MDRVMVYPGAIPLETDILNAEKNAYMGLAKLAAALFGTNALVNGLACTQNSPASLTVLVGPGEFYSLQNVDGTAYSSLAADTTHQIVKQGVLLNTTQLSCPAPGTVGYSINYLIEAEFVETDTNSVVLPYYNASNPAQAYSGPGGAGTANNTLRQDTISLVAKAGVAATTGTQTTPAPDSGYTGLWVVTVANGQSTITSTNIAAASGAPFLTETLLAKISTATGDARYLRPGSTLINIQYFLTAGTATYTPTTGAKTAVVDVQGGGGAGGGAPATDGSHLSGGAPGGTGGWARKRITSVSSQTVTVGAGGVGASGATGGTGGTSSFGAIVSATGGTGGATVSGTGATLVEAAGGLGGSGSGGDINLAGVPAPPFFIFNDSAPWVVAPCGMYMESYGSAGAYTGNIQSQSAQVGYAGAPGLVIVYEYA